MQTSEAFVGRDVRRAKGFDDAAATIFGGQREADDSLIGVEFTLARSHAKYSTVASAPGVTPKVYTIKTRHTHKRPAVTIYFACSDTHIDFLDIVLSEDDEG